MKVLWSLLIGGFLCVSSLFGKQSISSLHNKPESAEKKIAELEQKYLQLLDELRKERKNQKYGGELAFKYYQAYVKGCQ